MGRSRPRRSESKADRRKRSEQLRAAAVWRREALRRMRRAADRAH